jgi:hypothetical protein
MPELLRDLVERREIRNARIIDKDGDRPQRVATFRNRMPHLIPLGDIGAKRNSFPASGHNRLDGVSAPLLIQIQHTNLDALLCEAFCASSADSRCGARYQRYLVVHEMISA